MPQWLQGPLMEVWKVLRVHLPTIGFALAVLIGGWIIALILRRLVYKGLCRTTVDDKIASYVGYDTGGDAGNRIEKGIAQIIYYVAMAAVLVVFFSVLKIDAITRPLLEILNGLAAAVPNLAQAALFAVGGLLAALLLRALLRRTLMAVGFDKRFAEMDRDEEPKKEAPAKKKGKKRPKDETPPSEIIAQIAFWFVIVVTAIPVLNALKAGVLAGPLSAALERITSYLPQVGGAVVIGLIGYLAARIVRRLVTALLTRAGLDLGMERVGFDKKMLQGQSLSAILGNVAMAFVLLHAAISAFDQLGIPAISQPAGSVLEQIYDFAPKLFVGLILMAIGVALARIIGRVTARLAAAVGFNTLMAHIGVTKAVTREAKQQESAARDLVKASAGAEQPDEQATEGAAGLLGDADAGSGLRTPSDLVGVIVSTIIVLLFSRQVLSTIGLEGLAIMLDRLIAYLPQVLVAALIVGVGLWAGRFAESRLDELTRKSEDRLARYVGAVARVAIVVFAAMMAAQQLGVGQRLITVAFGLLLGALCLALALAFGLGGRDVASKIVAKEYEARSAKDG